MDSAAAVSYFRNIERIFRLLSVLNLTAYEWPNSECVQDGAAFDFIVVGGGTAGCVIASRLLDVNVSVLLIEAGTVPPLESDMSGLFVYLKKSKYDWNFTSTCSGFSRHHRNNVIHMSQGKMLGGSGSLNYGGYTRGYPCDYDNWAHITKDTSWSWESVLPIFQKNERLVDKKLLKCPKLHSYGLNGKIEIQKQYFPRNRAFYDALEEIGYDYHLDINEKHPLGTTEYLLNFADELRQSTPEKFLRPKKKNRYLHLKLKTLVTKVIFENKKAVGVEVLTADNKKQTYKARKEVIVTAGTIKSPHVLMLSGVGPKDHLEKKGIKVISDLPVGKNFQDHIYSNLVYKMTKSSHAHNLKDPNKYPFVIFDGYFALNKTQKYPDYEIIAVNIGDSASFLGICAFYFAFDYGYCDEINNKLDGKETFLVFIGYLNPKSRGEILLASSNPTDYPQIFPNYYAKNIDIDNHACYMADFHRILHTKFFKSMATEWIDPELKECDGIKRDTPEYWRCHAPATSDTTHFFVGTCAMGTVLDSRLRVHGVERLRVADASVMPVNVHGFTQATVMMIARKASDMIIEDWSLKKK